MTSKLYIVGVNRFILPEVVQPGRNYSFLGEVRLNMWALVALLVALVTRWLLRNHEDWGAPLRSILAVSPLIPSLCYVRCIARWIGGMDELQRRIQLEASLFATTGTVFLATALSLLESYGVPLSNRLQHGLGWEGTFAAVIALYILGNVIINRRYR
jgi:hypothetical protein